MVESVIGLFFYGCAGLLVVATIEILLLVALIIIKPLWGFKILGWIIKGLTPKRAGGRG